MADRPISGLTEATSMTNADLFAISQGGQAKKVTWETFYTYLAEALDGHGGISSITYTPPASGSRTGTMTINYADGSSPTTVEVTDGKEITAITQYFAVSSSSSTVPETWYTTRQSLTNTDRYLWSYFEFTFNDPQSEPIETPKTVIGVYGDKGDQGDTGDTGNGITSVDYVGTLDMVDTYRITFDNGTTTTFTVTNGSSIAEVKYLSSSGLVDTYEITLTTGETSTFDVTNGKSITAIVPVDVTHASGHTDVYRIDYNDGDSFTFYIYNGTNGTGSVSRVDGIAADGTQDVPLLLLGQGAPTPTTVGELKQRYFDQTNNVLYICTGIDTSTPDTTYNWQGAGVTVDNAFSSTSTNPVQNAIITGKVGTSSLNTTAQNLSDAINEHETDLAIKVDKVTGKGLSTNDFTDAYKNKIGTATLNTTAQDLSGAINEHEADFLGKVSKTGDTMTGNLDLQGDTSTSRNLRILDKTITVGNPPSSGNQYGGAIRFLDSNDMEMNGIQNIYTSGGATGLQIAAKQTISGTTYQNILHLRVNADGTHSVYINAPAAWRDALGAVNKAGDTITGNILFDGGVNYRGVRLKGASGSPMINFFNTGSRLTIDEFADGSTGGERYLLPVPSTRSSDAWYAILTSKTPVTLEQGGTGQTQGELETTIANIASPTNGCTISEASFLKWGKVAQLRLRIQKTAAVSSGQTRLATIVSGKRPNIGVAAGVVWASNKSCYIDPSGSVTVEGQISANETMYITATYILP